MFLRKGYWTVYRPYLSTVLYDWRAKKTPDEHEQKTKDSTVQQYVQESTVRQLTLIQLKKLDINSCRLVIIHHTSLFCAKGELLYYSTVLSALCTVLYFFQSSFRFTIRVRTVILFFTFFYFMSYSKFHSLIYSIVNVFT